VIEREAVTRLIAIATDAEEAALAAWLQESEERVAAVAAALADREHHGGAERQRAWDEQLAEDALSRQNAP
jgi:hypothetical protein